MGPISSQARRSWRMTASATSIGTPSALASATIGVLQPHSRGQYEAVNERLGIDMVWATIVVAAVAGSTFFGVLVLIEKKVTFWHPSNRR